MTYKAYLIMFKGYMFTSATLFLLLTTMMHDDYFETTVHVQRVCMTVFNNFLLLAFFD